MTDLRFRKRDEHGWRKPRSNTLSHKLYLLLLEGSTPQECAKRLKKPVDTVRVLLHKIQNPDKHNKLAAKSYRRKRQKA